MKTITIGDIHGMDFWKRISADDFDLIVFLGDYVDSFIIPDELMMSNFHEIVRFKKSYPQKVVLLLGNHEVSYLDRRYRATGFRMSIEEEVLLMLRANASLFQIACQFQNYLWSHAGIHQGFYDYNIKSKILDSDTDLAHTLDRLYHENYPPIFEIGPERGGSLTNIGGPLWLDKSLLISKPLKGFHQIVGHTPVITVKQYRPYPSDNETSVTVCDCLERGDGSFYELVLGKSE